MIANTLVKGEVLNVLDKKYDEIARYKSKRWQKNPCKGFKMHC